MAAPLGSVLDGTFLFLKAGVLADPSPLPTLVVCAKPDGTTVTPPALTHPSTGVFYAAQLFSALDTATLTGFYSAIAVTSDTTMDNPAYEVEWEIIVNNVINVTGNVSGSVGSVTGNVGGNVTGSVGSVLGNVAGSVASVVGNVGGNVVGSVGSVLGNIGGSVANVLALAQSALAQFFTTDTGEVYADAVDGSVVKEIAANVTASTVTSAFTDSALDDINYLMQQASLIGTAELTAISPTTAGGDIQVTRGMDYYAVDGFAYSFTLPTSGADLTGATGILYIATGGTPLAISSYSLNATTRVVVFQLSHTESAKALGSKCEIDVILANTHIWKVSVGTMTVTTGLAT